MIFSFECRFVGIPAALATKSESNSLPVTEDHNERIGETSVFDAGSDVRGIHGPSTLRSEMGSGAGDDERSESSHCGSNAGSVDSEEL